MRLDLAKKIVLGLVGALALAALGSGLAVVSARHTEETYKDLAAANLEQARAIHELEIALLEQGEFTSWYLMNGALKWLAELDRRKPYFDEWLARLDNAGLEPGQREYLEKISQAFRDYDAKRNEAIALYEAGNAGEAKRVLLDEVSVLYERVYQLCEALSDANDRDIDSAMSARRSQTRAVAVWFLACQALSGGLMVGLIWLFFRGVFRPLRRMADDARQYLKPEPAAAPRDDVSALGAYLRTLKSSVVEARSDLALSHKQLFDAEKLASIGRLAGGVAHEIRSPLTSLKLRLFSMQQALGGSPRHQDDCRVMSEEINRLDGIIRNFLDFSRPPEVSAQRCNVSLLIDKTLELLRYRIAAGAISVERDEAGDLPAIWADSQQIRQVFINLLNNALDVLPSGGQMRITAARAFDGRDRPMVVVRVGDNGPGVRQDVVERIFDPFFSTKRDGAGLGLWIAQRIMTQHGGLLELESSSPRGSVFAAWIPAAPEDKDGQDSGRR
ncbi:MAG: ATP-binding protein [Candidatus Sumerlaeota bacterium]|nr:ATP-binding protein [Candidatus Sumerlaeota bacterium]